MMKPGAYLVHNETDPHIESVSPVFGLSTVETSTFLLSPSGQPALMQAFVIQQKKRAAQKQ
jgi:hypothetical protein